MLLVHTGKSWCECEEVYKECELERFELLNYLPKYKVFCNCDYACCVMIMTKNSYLLSS